MSWEIAILGFIAFAAFLFAYIATNLDVGHSLLKFILYAFSVLLLVLGGAMVIDISEASAGQPAVSVTIGNTSWSINPDYSIFYSKGNVNVGGENGYADGGSTLYTNGNGYFAGDILLDGSVITVQGQSINGSMNPISDNTFNLGNSSNRWKNLYTSNSIYSNGTIQSGNNFIITPSGNVGIGTTGPGNPLDIRSANVLLTAGNGQIALYSTDSQAIDKGGQITLGGSYTGTTKGDFATISGRKENGIDGNYASYLAFATIANGDAARSEKMRITSTGNVGIGTTNPELTLQMRGLYPAIGFIETGVTADNTKWDFMVDAEQLKGRLVNDANSAAANWLVVDRTGNTVDQVVFPTGNVGIGTTVPGSKLDIIGMTTGDATFNHTVLIGDDTAMATGVGGLLLFSGRPITADTTQYYGPYIRAAKTNGNSGDYGFDLVLGTRANGASPTERVRIDSSGNVGIGTTNPTHKLNVVGDVNITGSLYVLNQNMTVPDYVFEKNYSLMPLSELKAYTEKNKKLPESKIYDNFSQKDYQDVVKTQFFLLEKLEELTLHIISLFERIVGIEDRVSKLEKENRELKNQLADMEERISTLEAHYEN